jgi:hypothetical protein
LNEPGDLEGRLVAVADDLMSVELVREVEPSEN